MSRPGNALFLERRTYRRRRLVDAARFLPILGAVLWSVPLLWSSDGAETVPTSRAILYVFGVWCFLIVAAFLLSTRLRSDPPEEPVERP